MKQTNAINMGINETAKIETQPTKADVFFGKAKEFCKNTKEFLVIAGQHTWATAKRAAKWTQHFVHACINMTVKLSIILIALVAIVNFMEAHPAETAQAMSTIQNLFENVKNAFMDIVANIWFFG
jgi:hypothetical protein